MRKILIGILLFTSVLSYGQRFPFPNSGHLGAAFDGGLITNGDFSDGTTAWDVLGDFEITGGEAVYDYAGAGYSLIRQSDTDMQSSLQESVTYELSFTISDSPSGLRFTVYNYAINNQYVAAATYSEGSHTVEFIESTNISGICFYAVSASNDGTIDNVKVIIKP